MLLYLLVFIASSGPVTVNTDIHVMEVFKSQEKCNHRILKLRETYPVRKDVRLLCTKVEIH